MSKKKSSPKLFKFAGFPAFLIGAVVAGATVAYVKNTPAGIPKEEKRVERLPEHQEPKKVVEKEADSDPAEVKTVLVRKPKYNGTDLSYSKTTESVKAGENKYLVAINGFLKNAKVTAAGIDAKSAKLDGSTLVLDFAKGFEGGYSTEDEHVLLDGILKTASQFSEVKTVKFLVNGQSIESIGNVDLTEPQAVLRDE